MHQYAVYIQPILSKMLGEYRKLHHYSQETMAENLRISPRSYSDLELGKSKFSGPSLLFFILTMTEAEQLAALQSLKEAIYRIDTQWDYAVFPSDR